MYQDISRASTGEAEESLENLKVAGIRKKNRNRDFANMYCGRSADCYITTFGSRF